MRPVDARRKLLLLVLLAPALTTLHAADTKPLFFDWMTKSGKAGLAYANDEVETADVCMKETNVDGCSCYGRTGVKDCCHSYTLDVEMACSDKTYASYEKHYKSGQRLKSQFEVDVINSAKCTYRQSYLEEAVEVSKGDDTLLKVGDFTGSCYFNNEAASCGQPACEGMTVTIQGDIFKATRVAFEGPIISPKRSAKCLAIFGGDCKEEKKVVGATKAYNEGEEYNYHRSGQDTSAEYDKHSEYGYEKQPEKPYYYKEEEKEYEGYDKHDSYGDEKEEEYYPEKKQYYTGSGLVFIGTFYTTSRMHNSQYQTGLYQLVENLEYDSQTPYDAPPEGYYTARSSEATFKFVKGKEAAYTA